MNQSSDTTQPTSPAMGMHLRTSFACEARCFCNVGDAVWIGERCGIISIRCARTGQLQHTIEQPARHLFATAMTVSSQNEIWVGTSDGRLCVFNVTNRDLLCELTNPETEKSGEILSIAQDHSSVFVGSTGCRVMQWDGTSKTFVQSFIHTHAVNAVVVHGAVCYAGDASGRLVAWDIKSGDRATENAHIDSGISTMCLEPSTRTLWTGRFNGTVAVFSLAPALALLDTRSDPKARVNSLLSVGGKVWGGGVDKFTYVWHAQTRQLLGKSKDHNAFVFQLGKLYTMETARVWSLANDKTVKVYDAEGFFAPIRAEGMESEELSQAHSTAQSLRMELKLMERKLTLEKDKVHSRDIEIDKMKEELAKTMLKIHALEHVVDMKEEAIHGSQADRMKMAEETTEMSNKVNDLVLKLNQSEMDKMVMKGDMARVEEELARCKASLAERTSQTAIAETERVAINTDKDRIQKDLKEREELIEKLNAELKRSKDEAVSKGVELNRKTREHEFLVKRVQELETERSDFARIRRGLEEEKRRMGDTLIVRENEVKDLLGQVKSASDIRTQHQSEIKGLASDKLLEQETAQKTQETFLLKSHQYDLLREERESLEKTLSHERQQLGEAKGNEQRLKLQNDELRRQIETEKNAVKMLEDQYSIFQFVINSRGELVNSLWQLHGKLASATKTLKSLDSGINSIDPTKDRVSLKRDWKVSVVDRAHSTLGSVSQVQKQVDYIVANYLSEYEKLHLGISTAKFAPDAARPAVVGDQLLAKLRDVTLMKQFSLNQGGTSSSVAAAVQASKPPLPPPFSSQLGPEHLSYNKENPSAKTSLVTKPTTQAPPNPDLNMMTPMPQHHHHHAIAHVASANVNNLSGIPADGQSSYIASSYSKPAFQVPPPRDGFPPPSIVPNQVVEAQQKYAPTPTPISGLDRLNLVGSNAQTATTTTNGVTTTVTGAVPNATAHPLAGADPLRPSVPPSTAAGPQQITAPSGATASYTPYVSPYAAPPPTTNVPPLPNQLHDGKETTTANSLGPSIRPLN